MKALLALSLLFVSAAYAGVSDIASLKCTDGRPGYDEYINLEIKNGAIAYQRHESGFKLSADLTSASGSAISVVDKTVQVTAEGDKFPVRITALFVYDEASKNLSSTVIYDNNIQHVETRLLKCQ